MNTEARFGHDDKVMRAYEETLDHDDLKYSKAEGSLESEAIPNKLVEKIESIVQRRVEEELKKSADKQKLQ
eukprot:CAMPEP_0170455184 /NCGR_PEP_ID=MMETSP0123-20130129/3217_1 /TAXON_ID=182087 /ORGANISM="Favella ehrenbergii, Strain Fehren 1" /LENGTH=70 /DNA_ID=CAMNT_0010718205 /DNA_START=1515 /DNA_END=1727 /DNA_ORIENTATION=+